MLSGKLDSQDEGLSPEELESEEASELPDREAMSVISSPASPQPIFGIGYEQEPVYTLPYERSTEM